MIDTIEERKQKITERINGVAPRWNAEYPFDPRLQYMYPAPTITILTNIANAMAAVPRFYVQVLHLMNKMNLPAPFGLPTLPPPIPIGSKPPLPPEVDKPPEPDTFDREEMDFSSTEESELESDGGETGKKVDGDVAKRPRKRVRHAHYHRKRLRLQIQMQAQILAIAGIMPKQAQQLSEVFEQPQPAVTKKIEIKKISDDINRHETSIQKEMLEEQNSSVEISTQVVGGFGKIEPERKDQPVSDDEADEEWGVRDFISSRRLQRGRLSEKERNQLDVFKNYESGEPTSRLYIKNLAKKVTEKDLHYIYGRYVDWDVETDKSMFYVQLLTGRMKGQAFITLPSETKAKEALKETNGFELHGKALVVQFARSAKPKDKTESAVN